MLNRRFKAALLRPFFIFLIFPFLASAPATAQNKPTLPDYSITYATLGVTIASQLFKEHLAPRQPHWVSAPQIDETLRRRLVWKTERLKNAVFYSDVLLYGLTLHALLITPAIDNDRFGDVFLNEIQLLATTGLVTNSVKFLSGRERPYARFGTLPSNGVDDNLSFFSGHSSLAFAAAISSAMRLENKYPHSSAIIWGASLSAAGATAYLRVAGDKHYFSDVTTGALLGSTLAWLLSKRNEKRYLRGSSTQAAKVIYITWPL